MSTVWDDEEEPGGTSHWIPSRGNSTGKSHVVGIAYLGLFTGEGAVPAFFILYPSSQYYVSISPKCIYTQLFKEEQKYHSIRATPSGQTSSFTPTPLLLSNFCPKGYKFLHLFQAGVNRILTSVFQTFMTVTHSGKEILHCNPAST